jgi:hypothetical protein
MKMFTRKVTPIEVLLLSPCKRGYEWFSKYFPDGATLEEMFIRYANTNDWQVEWIGWYLRYGKDTPRSLKNYCLKEKDVTWETFCAHVDSYGQVFYLAYKYYTTRRKKNV